MKYPIPRYHDGTIDKTEVELQLKFSESQLEWFKGHMHLNVALGKEDVARRYLEYMEECAGFQDRCRRILADRHQEDDE